MPNNAHLHGILFIALDGCNHLPYYDDDIADRPPADLLLHGGMGMNWNEIFSELVAPK